MVRAHKACRGLSLLLGAVAMLATACSVSAQVSPAEIVNPDLKSLEAKYFPQLKTLHREIGTLKFPFPFLLSRYVGLNPDKQAEADSRGLEFVRFHERIVLKITGNYNAAYNAEMLTRNQRASRTVEDVMLPVLRLVSKEIPPEVDCEAIGFEVAHHVRSRIKNADYEGKEILVVLLDREDAFALAAAADDSDRQEILNRSEVYVNGEQFGLSLGAKDPLDLEALSRPVRPSSTNTTPGPARTAASGSDARAPVRILNPNGDLRVSPPSVQTPSKTAPAGGAPVAPGQPTPALASAASVESGQSVPAAADAPAVTPADAERLQAKYQSQLDALTKKGVDGILFVDYAPPSLAVFQNRVVLQATLRNPLHFEKDTSSIYRRAAQSFDLFLALHLKPLLDQFPQDAEIAGLDITLLNQISAAPKPTSEALEFVFPLRPLRKFVDAEITNQDLINQSVVLVNGVRIALNLQLVE